MRVLVVGAGVIGAVYAARFAEAGHDVSLLARGARRSAFEADGVTVRAGGRTLHTHPRIVGAEDAGGAFDLTVVAVRTTQLDAILDLLRANDSPTVAFLQHLGPHADRVRRVLGSNRTVFAFPGVGGLVSADGSVEYVDVAAQPTTIDATAERAIVLRSAIASTGMRTAMEPDMPGWLATHEVFVACLGAGILNSGGDAPTLAANHARLLGVVQSVREGFVSLSSSGTTVTPKALRVLFSRMPRWFAAAYWRRALRGPVGTVAIAPHVRASRDDEFADLCSDVLARVGDPDRTPTLTPLLTPWAGDMS
ncbi:ketopantoate reductase family protein [Tessaracoccus antarcticus]|uniref:Ketopantoate reductase family protein n=1 Tax=Tessaracoccus antarcticus TaxID=2479848 RepID=A0A3M0G2F0_9ACTN|nr:2-dehydropantoate 2-reductase N-terminal domain-containing protein [Tessaracoccus antarcticus]RMB58945.1 ketopantoate reductase family protein [Tessaracoccus antarcticus]